MSRLTRARALQRAKYIPLRLNVDERDLLRLLVRVWACLCGLSQNSSFQIGTQDGALRVSEYTDHVDVTSHDYGWGWSFNHSVTKKGSKMDLHLREFLQLLLGLHLCFDFREGQKRVKQAMKHSVVIFQHIFEVGRRYKIMNPDRMRSTYGKLVHILQDMVSA